jgi:predicted nucleic acid-binding Zn ribbon protein
MPTYVYETIPQKPGDAVVQFEIKQSMKDDPLSVHPETGMPVRRVISGGYGLIGANTGRSGSDAAPAKESAGHSHGGGGCCGGSCGCKH